MSKTHFPQNKEQLAAIVAVTVTVLVFLANGYILATSLSAVYLDKGIPKSEAPIDTKTVTEAIKLLEQ